MPFLILSEDFMFSFSAFSLRALIAQSVEHGANNARVVGSSPTGSIFCSVRDFYFYFHKIQRDKTTNCSTRYTYPVDDTDRCLPIYMT